MRVTEEELRELLKTHGWNLIQRRRGRQNYLYARKWANKEFYVTKVASLPQLKPEDVLGLIKKASGE